MSPIYINSMETYSNFISQFEIFENPRYKKGFDRHHIVPVSEQTESDNRQVYLTLPQHMYAHILYDREHDTHTANRFLSICGKPLDYFDCWEKVLECADTLRKKKEEQFKKSAESHRTPEFRQKKSDSVKGEKHPLYGRTGENNPNYGKHRTEETKKKMSDSRKGEKHPFYGKNRPEETKKKIADSRKGTLHSEETKKKIAEKHTCLLAWNNGIVNKRSKECPGPEWVRGFVKRA